MATTKKATPAKAVKPITRAAFKKWLIGEDGPLADENDEGIETITEDSKLVEFIQSPREYKRFKSYALFVMAANGRKKEATKLWPANWQDMTVKTFAETLIP